MPENCSKPLIPFSDSAPNIPVTTTLGLWLRSRLAACRLGVQRRLHVGLGPGRASVEHDRGAVDLDLDLEGGIRLDGGGEHGRSRFEPGHHHAVCEAEEAEQREGVGDTCLQELAWEGAGEGDGAAGDLARGARVVAEVVGARLGGPHGVTLL